MASSVTFDAAGPSATGYYNGSFSGTGSFAHVNSDSGNAILVGITDATTKANQVTAVAYGGVALAFLGYQTADGTSGSGGISLYGTVGGLPTGSNTVLITSGASVVCAGALTFGGADHFGSVFAGFSNAATVGTTVSGTTAGGMIAAFACMGGAGLSAFTAATGGTRRINDIGDSNAGADNLGAATWPSPGGSQAAGFSGGNDWWGLLAVEVLPPSGPAVTTTTLPDGNVGTAYDQTLTAAGGATPYTWAVTAGALPSWASLDTSTGEITGTPDVTGTSSFTVQVTDSAAAAATQALTVTADPPVSGPNPATAGSGLADGTGSWANPGRVAADDGSAATWTVVLGDCRAARRVLG